MTCNLIALSQGTAIILNYTSGGNGSYNAIILSRNIFE